MKFKCAHCGKTGDKPTGEVNRAEASGLRLFCNRRCSGLAKRTHKTKSQKRAEKKAYDALYRVENLATITAKKRAYFKRTYDPAKAAVERKKRMPLHVEYCRRPEYKRWKKTYDRRHRAEKFYGPFAEVAMLTLDLNREIKGRMNNHDIKWQNQTCNKTQFRRRADKAQERTRPRNRERRDGHTAAHG